VEPVLERGDDAEVAAAAADGPEEVGVLLLARGEDLALRGHDVRGHEVVDGGAVLAHQPADPSAERQARDPGVGDDPADRRQPEVLRLAVELSPEHAGLGPRGTGRRIDSDPLHRREVDDEPAVADRVSADTVAAGADADEQGPLTGEADRRDDVGDAGAAGDAGGAPVDGAVPDRACGVVAVVAGTEHLATEDLA
jgi:hypothetical protein